MHIRRCPARAPRAMLGDCAANGRDSQREVSTTRFNRYTIETSKTMSDGKFRNSMRVLR